MPGARAMLRRFRLPSATATVLVAAMALASCSRQEAPRSDLFVGKWRSSRLATPLYLHANGDWEIKTDEGAVLQYGVWESKGRRFVWSIKQGSEINQDVNEVLSAGAQRFQLREANGTTTTFDKLDVIR